MPNFNYPQKTRQAQHGISLVEILLALLLGIIILLGTTKAFKHLNNNNQLQLTQNSLQNTADMTLAHFSNRLENALTMPCGSLQALQKSGKLHIESLTKGHGDKTITRKHENLIKRLIRGTGVQITQKDIVIGEQKLHTDDLTFITAKEHFLVTKTVTSATTEILFNTNFITEPKDTIGIAKRDAQIFLITDCKNTNIFSAIVRYQESQGHSNLKLENIYGPGMSNYQKNKLAMISPLLARTISIDDRHNLDDKMIFDRNIGNTLMNDVLLMRLIFGIDSVGDDGVADTYITAAQLNTQTAPSKITSIQIHLLVQVPSFQKSFNTPESYTISIPDTKAEIPSSGNIPMQSITFSDRIARKVFSKTIALYSP